MATVRDVCDGALRRIGVLESGENAPGEDMAVAQAAFDGLHFEAVTDGWLASFTASALGDSVTAAYVETLKSAVAVRIAADFGREVPPRVAMEGKRWGAMLANAHWSNAANNHTTERGVWEPRAADSDLIDP